MLGSVALNTIIRHDDVALLSCDWNPHKRPSSFLEKEKKFPSTHNFRYHYVYTRIVAAYYGSYGRVFVQLLVRKFNKCTHKACIFSRPGPVSPARSQYRTLFPGSREPLRVDVTSVKLEIQSLPNTVVFRGRQTRRLFRAVLLENSHRNHKLNGWRSDFFF